MKSTSPIQIGTFDIVDPWGGASLNPVVRNNVNATPQLWLSRTLTPVGSGMSLTLLQWEYAYGAPSKCPGTSTGNSSAGSARQSWSDRGRSSRPGTVLSDIRCQICIVFGNQTDPDCQQVTSVPAANVFARHPTGSKAVFTVDQDWAVLTLDRDVPAAAAISVTLAKSAPTQNQLIYMTGYPDAWPVKLTNYPAIGATGPGGTTVAPPSAATVLQSDVFTFRTTLDMLSGNSGGGVFDLATNALVGIAVNYPATLASGFGATNDDPLMDWAIDHSDCLHLGLVCDCYRPYQCDFTPGVYSVATPITAISPSALQRVRAFMKILFSAPTGWASDDAVPSVSVSVQMKVDGAVVETVVANQLAPDPDTDVQGAHGFSWTIPRSTRMASRTASR